jgi:GTPase
MNFVDYVKIDVKSGDGGRGAVSFRREKYVPKGGPDGGDGGRGGSVKLRADRQLATLIDQTYRRRYEAQNGQAGMGKKMHGKNGEDVVITVPVGTLVRDAASNEIIEDLDEHGKEVVVAVGGKGGLGNSHFATPVRRVPRYAQPGLQGEEKSLILELKLLADAGLIGLPNAGKSTLLSVISAARPKVAEYPFTSLRPTLGVVKLEDFTSFVVADIPGLIEGAHKGVGLGFQFLRHIERTKVLVHLIDVGPTGGDDPGADFEKINRELALYSPELMQKPQIVAATKVDTAEEEKMEVLEDYCRSHALPFLPVSAVTGRGVRELIARLSQRLREEKDKDEIETARP